jgi:hypothetical protein
VGFGDADGFDFSYVITEIVKKTWTRRRIGIHSSRRRKLKKCLSQG